MLYETLNIAPDRTFLLATSFQKPSNDKSISAWYASYIVATWLTVILFYRTEHAVDAVHGSGFPIFK
jgi:hypothetical protein